MKTLSVICARAGSKGLRNKCLQMISGKMVVEYSIGYSLSLGGAVKTVVSTDIAELIDFCKKNKIVYIERSPSICMDGSMVEDALADAIEKEGAGCDCCSLVYGNVPTRYPGLFHEAVSFLEAHNDYDAVVSMQNVEKFNPEWMLDFNEELLPVKKASSYRRQELPQKMIHDGHTLLSRTAVFYERYKGRVAYDDGMYSMFGSKIKPLINEETIIDIDTAKDLKLAKMFLAGRSA